MRKYEFGEVMSDEDSLAHYGVKGMKWGKRKSGPAGDLKRMSRSWTVRDLVRSTIRLRRREV